MAHPFGLGIGGGLAFVYGGLSLAEQIAELFGSGEDGAWYDPSDLTSMYVGRNGSGGNPDVGDVVGVILDKSQMGGKTAENFIAGQTNLAIGETLTFQNAPDSTDNGDGSFTVAGAVAGDNCALNGSTLGTSGVFYEVAFTISSISGDSVTLQDPTGSNVGEISATGTYKYIFKSDGATALFRMVEWAGTLTDISASFTIKEIPGNHAIAPSDAARPVLRDEIAEGTSVNVSGQPELVTNGTFDADSDWTKGTDWSITGGALVSASAGNYATSQSGVCTSNKWYKVTLDATVSSGYFLVYLGNGESQQVNLTGSATYVLNSGTSGTALTLFGFAFNGSIDNISVKEVPASAARYYYLDADGTDDVLLCSPNIDLSSTDYSLAAAYNYPSLNNGAVIGGSEATTDANPHLGMNGAGAWIFAQFANDVSDTGAAAATNYVHVGRRNGSGRIMRVNGTQEASDSDTTQLTASLGMGLFRHFNEFGESNLYGAVIIDRALTDSEIALVEAYLASKSGVTL